MAQSLILSPGRGSNLLNSKNDSVQGDDDEKGDRLIKSTFDLLEKGEKEIKFDDNHKDVILILGNTGSGKSTFTQWIAGDNTKMISVETNEGTGEYIIEDHNRIGSTTLKSKTVFPELVIDAKTNTAFYDCPGFSDTQGTSNDIATTYFIKRVLDYSESIKMVFTISHPSVRKGVDRQDFMKLLRHVADLVKDIEKFKLSVAIVVTKVDNQYIKQGSTFNLVPEDKVIAAIADFLQEAKQYLAESSQRSNLSEKEKQFYPKAITFVDILLEKDSGNYPKIGLFRRPDEPGPISGIQLLQNGKKDIEQIVYDKLIFTAKNNEDFGYTVSEKSKNDIHDIVEEINKNLWSSLSKFSGKVQEYYGRLEEKIRCQIRLFISEINALDLNISEAQLFSNKFSTGCSIASDLAAKLKNLTNPEELAPLVNKTAASLEIDISDDEILFISNQGKYFNFLQVVSDQILSSKPYYELFQDLENFLSSAKRNISYDAYSASEKINNRIQNNLNHTLEAMCSEYREKLKSLEIQKLPEKLNRDSRTVSDLANGIKNETTTESLMEIIHSIAENLDVTLLKENLQNITIQGNNIELLEVLSKERLLDRPTAWLSPFKIITTQFYESGHWYTFLVDLYYKLSEYGIQKDRERYNVADIRDWGQTGKPQGISVTSYTFEEFLNKIGNYNLSEYETIKKLSRTTDYQIEELNQVLSLTLKHRSVIRCSKPLITVHGDYVCLNETMQSILSNSDTDNSCNNFKAEFPSGKYTLMKVFALNKIFIDTDLSFSGKELSIAIVAPKWEIIGSRSIDLSGADGATYPETKAKNGVYSGNDGRNGAPGNPGKSGESFFGVGSVYLNGENLEISSNGGKGGKGQDGGDGTPVVPGKDAYTPSNSDPPCEDGYVRGFKCEGLPKKGGGGGMVILAYVHREWSCNEKGFKIFGSLCKKGGNGGNGGIGGKGGYKGNIDILELGQPSKVAKLTVEGKEGDIGKGGNGAQEGKNGNDVIAHWTRCYPSALAYLFGSREYTKWEWKETIKNYGRCVAGRIGKNGDNSMNINSPSQANGISKKASLINDYISYLRENLNNRFKKLDLLRFLEQLDDSKDVRKLYDILGFIEEFQGLEKQFHSFSHQIDFSLFYSSLLERIKEFAEIHKDSPNSQEDRKVLNYLYTAILGRIHNFKGNSDSYLVLDIRVYLNLIKENVKTLKDIQTMNNKVDIINKYKEDYKNHIDQKIKEAKNFIKGQLNPEIENISENIDDQLNSLIEETIAMEKQAEKQKQKLAEKKEELENALEAKGIFGLFHFIGGIVSFMGPVGAIAGAVIEITTTVGESLALNDQQKTLNLPSDIVSELKSLGDQINTMRNEKIAYLNKILDNVSEEIRNNPETLNDMGVKIADIKDRLKSIGENKSDFKQVRELEKEINRELKRKEDDLKMKPSDKKSADALKIIGKLTQIAQFCSSMLNVYEQMKGQKEKIDAVTDAMQQIDNKIKKLKEYEENIYDTIVPMFQKMEDDMKNISDKLGNKSHVALDVTKWQVQSALKDMRLLIKRITKNFDVKDDLNRSIEKMDEVMTTLINIYDRIQSYQDQQIQANYIADISSVAANRINIKNPQFVNPINILESAIRSNIVLNQYKSALDSFKQWVFPLVDRYVPQSMLPSTLELDTDVQTLVQNAMSGIEAMNKELVLYNATVRKGDQYLETEEFSSQYISTQPFFVWKNEEYGKLIADLLSGKEVVLKSDVKKSTSHKDAIKFSEIEFYFKTENKTAQALLLETLKAFDVKATHIGNSYYRYLDEISLIISDSVTISYSIEKNKAGLPVRSNKNYRQLKAGDFLLSPFTLWEVKLEQRANNYSFHDLEPFKKQVNIELSGFGSYVDTNDFKAVAHKLMVHNDTDASDLKSNATDANDCAKYTHRLKRTPKENDLYGVSLTSGASGISSPINFLYKFLNTYFLTNVISSMNQIFLRDQTFIRNDNSTGMHKKRGKFDTTMAPFLTIPDTDAEDNKAKESSKSDYILNENFEYKNIFSNHNLLGDEKNAYNSNSLQVPNLNCTLLLADVVSRTLTGNKYKQLMNKSSMSPQELVLLKISTGMVRNELEVKQNLQRLSMEKDDVRPSSWVTKLKSFTDSMFQLFGFVGNDNHEDYVQDVRKLFEKGKF